MLFNSEKVEILFVYKFLTMKRKNEKVRLICKPSVSGQKKAKKKEKKEGKKQQNRTDKRQNNLLIICFTL